MAHQRRGHLCIRSRYLSTGSLRQELSDTKSAVTSARRTSLSPSEGQALLGRPGLLASSPVRAFPTQPMKSARPQRRRHPSRRPRKAPSSPAALLEPANFPQENKGLKSRLHATCRPILQSTTDTLSLLGAGLLGLLEACELLGHAAVLAHAAPREQATSLPLPPLSPSLSSVSPLPPPLSQRRSLSTPRCTCKVHTAANTRPCERPAQPPLPGHGDTSVRGDQRCP